MPIRVGSLIWSGGTVRARGHQPSRCKGAIPMPRKKPDDSLAGLYSDVPAVPGGRLALEAAAAETRDRLMASTRPDMGGAPVNLMLTPQSYQQRVMRIWDSYSMDPLFHRLVNRVVEFAANG